MMFRNWLEQEESKSIRDLLKGVPQSPIHHPEGDVWKHSRLTRRAMDRAIEGLKAAQQEPDSPFSNLDLNLTKDERNMLRIAGLFHDIGKESATAWTTASGKRVPWREVPEAPETALGGKGWQSIGHEDPKHIEAATERLSPFWRKLQQQADPKDLEDLKFIIQNHMSLMSKKAFDWMNNEGKFKNDRRIKLLLLVILMDQLGRGVGPSVSIDKMKAVSLEKKKKIEQQRRRAQEQEQQRIATTTPESMIQWWIQMKKPLSALPGALKGKFGLNDNEINKLL